jgi:hypothetical protein
LAVPSVVTISLQLQRRFYPLLVRRTPPEFQGKFIAIKLMALRNQEVMLLDRKGVLMAANMAKTPKAATGRLFYQYFTD